jgi:hypothetical protein
MCIGSILGVGEGVKIIHFYCTILDFEVREVGREICHPMHIYGMNCLLVGITKNASTVIVVIVSTMPSAMTTAPIQIANDKTDSCLKLRRVFVVVAL